MDRTLHGVDSCVVWEKHFFVPLRFRSYQAVYVVLLHKKRKNMLLEQLKALMVCTLSGSRLLRNASCSLSLLHLQHEPQQHIVRLSVMPC